MFRLFYVAMALLLSLPCFSQDSIPCSDSLHVDTIAIEQEHTYKLTTKNIVVPVAMVVVGYALTGCKQKKYLNDGILEISGGHRARIDDYAQYLPIMTNVIAGNLGVKHKHGLAERTVMTFNSALLMLCISRSIKHFTWERRPGDEGTNSFPSGHTATAFSGAELVRLEYGGATGIAAYSVAGLVGVLRIYNNKHWANDVLAGAGIGILSARIGYWLFPYEKKLFDKLFRTSRNRSNARNKCDFVLMPYYGEKQLCGCSLTLTL